jgi:hypothetical protein
VMPVIFLEQASNFISTFLYDIKCSIRRFRTDSWPIS